MKSWNHEINHEIMKHLHIVIMTIILIWVHVILGWIFRSTGKTTFQARSQ
jgi:hypothetical protein